MPLEQVVYRAKAKATGGRDGRATSSDGVLDVKLGVPKEMGGAGGEVTNPEQLFAAGYSACFLGAMKFVANRDKLKITNKLKLSNWLPQRTLFVHIQMRLVAILM